MSKFKPLMLFIIIMIMICIILGKPIILFVFAPGLFVMYIFPKLRCIIMNPLRTIFYFPIDVFYYFLHKKYNNLKTGELVAIIGYFRKGKTLTGVHIVASLYFRKHGKRVWCSRRKKMVTQRVRIFSNVSFLDIPYERFISLAQIVNASKENNVYDDLNNTLTVTLVLGDEFSSQMNSRSFKSNIDPLVLSTILACGHYFLQIYYTTQRFQLTDALLRQVTSYCIDCRKTWRLQGINYYDAWEMENATSPLAVQPYKRAAWFVTNRDYGRYNTLETVENIKKSVESGDMLSEEQILSLQAMQISNDNIVHPSKTFRRFRKKMTK